MTKSFISPDDLRARFSRAMSEMYRKEVPAYGTLLELVRDVNERVLAADPALRKQLEETDNLERISEERHGAIRLGKASELQMIARVFGVMGMQPVGYYDLTQANVPVHSTAFRAVEGVSLSRSPFRVFTSLLRTELIKDQGLREKAEELLAARDIFSDTLRALVDKAERQDGLNETDTQRFIAEATKVFQWHSDAAPGVSKALYIQMRDADPRVADIVCFKGPHINHLTPRTLEIDTIQADMPKRGMNAKNVVEGPPGSCPILLRQTSFRALTEKVRFAGEEGEHTARFGEIEQRSAALTPKGRQLYDQLLARVLENVKPKADGSNASEYNAFLYQTFRAFPSDPAGMRREGLAYFQYYVTEKGRKHKGQAPTSLDGLVESGLVAFAPIVYEDFLPVSAAGIFASNAATKDWKDDFERSSKADFEAAMGHEVLDPFALYAAIEKASLTKVAAAFGLKNLSIAA
ncbi:MAG: VOC family protein [Alphaproteobacteria bacterium]|nr:VOC family protein [Alphaproteobacteria bacterium]MBP7758212.1 VOC family protein [Alphaproteobacteria bacterium]MBP7761645.1 VOC family protein [Alphaproteobacteria bacterium]MBP7904003.1 VOC family protein [Alphaproteobacteria bacterium]